jgi:aldehyde dehydrogenase (NAD+)
LLATGKLITSISEATEKDVDLAVAAAEKAFETVWGLNTPGSKRGEALWALAQAMERHKDELAAIESLDNGEFFPVILLTLL